MRICYIRHNKFRNKRQEKNNEEKKERNKFIPK